MAKKKMQGKKKVVGKSPAKRKGPKPGSKRESYSEGLKLRVVKAVRKGMTHIEAADFFKVGKHSIPNWLKKYI